MKNNNIVNFKKILYRKKIVRTSYSILKSTFLLKLTAKNKNLNINQRNRFIIIKIIINLSKKVIKWDFLQKSFMLKLLFIFCNTLKASKI